MGRKANIVKEWEAIIGTAREGWREYNLQVKMFKEAQRARRKVLDKQRPKCRCEAYPWPHRPRGGLCRYPDPPLERYQRKTKRRPYCQRYTGILRQIARANGLHPIKDRVFIETKMQDLIRTAKWFHLTHRKYRYRHMEITEKGLCAHWQAYGPDDFREGR